MKHVNQKSFLKKMSRLFIWLELTRHYFLLFSINSVFFLMIRIGILAKMKEGAENVERKIQAKVESLKHANEGDKGKYIQLLKIENAF